MEKQLKSKSSFSAIKSMLKADLRRAFTTPLFYIMLGVALAIPILILVMTTMMNGSVSVNPTTGEETVMEGFKNVWQIIGSVSGGSTDNSTSMDLVAMCNIDLMYFMIVVFTCLFIGEEFKCGYVKNLFAVRATKTDYVISKTLICFLASSIMIAGFFIGSVLGGAIAGLPFSMEGFNVGNLICCILAKLFLSGVFVAIHVLMSVIAKQRIWLSIVLSFAVGMFLFNIVSIVAPLNSNILNLVFALVGAMIFSIGLGAISNLLLNKRDVL